MRPGVRAESSRLDWRYAEEVSISRCIALTDQPRATNSVASQSSSSGWLGARPFTPKFSGVATIPSPKWCSQSLFTSTRAVSG